MRRPKRCCSSTGSGCLAAKALRQIGALYEIEDEIRTHRLTGENKRLHRLTHSKPRVDKFFAWVAEQFERQVLAAV